jgi:16S rRNA (cytidine1402-2'-O)-methyltransferase
VSIEPGQVYVVGTPIGNLADITQRAIEVLRGVDLIAAEDTRRTRRLLQHLGIHNELISVHEHNERSRVPELLQKLARDCSIALVTDAGTPLISDPGYRLVRAAREAGYRIVPVPGPCSVTAALCAAGLPTDRFVFEGFLPARATARRKFLEALGSNTATMVFFETGMRLPGALEDMEAVFGSNREAVVAKEITKLHEHFERGSLCQLRSWIARDAQIRRGEFVLVVAGRDDHTIDEDEPRTLEILALLLDELPASRAAALTARITGGRKRELYEAALRMTSGDA